MKTNLQEVRQGLIKRLPIEARFVETSCKINPLARIETLKGRHINENTTSQKSKRNFQSVNRVGCRFEYLQTSCMKVLSVPKES